MKNSHLLTSKLNISFILRILIAACIGLLSTVPLMAQSKWAVEFRPAIHFPTRQFAETNLNIGFGFDGLVSYSITPQVGLYAGWGWNMFPKDNLTPDEQGFEETGYSFGASFKRPFNNSGINYFFKAGGIYNHIEVENDADIVADSGHELGWQLETGLSVPLGSGISINPAVRYRELAGNISLQGAKTGFQLHYLSLGVGIAKNFR